MAVLPTEFLLSMSILFMLTKMYAICNIPHQLFNRLQISLPPTKEELEKYYSAQTKRTKKTSSKQRPDPPQILRIKVSEGQLHRHAFYDEYYAVIVIASCALVNFFLIETYACMRAKPTIELGICTTLIAIFYIFWCKAQIIWAQGWASIEVKLCVMMGLFAFFAAFFLLFLPPSVLDFDMEEAFNEISRGFETFFTKLDLVAPSGITSVLLKFALALFAGAQTCLFFLPSWRFARCYCDMISMKPTEPNHSMLQPSKLLLHLNFFMPLLAAICWVCPLSKDLLLPANLIKCEETDITQDCISNIDGDSNDHGAQFFVTEAAWDRFRFGALIGVCTLRMYLMRAHLQSFLDSARISAIKALQKLQPNGNLASADNDVSRKLRHHYQYLCVVALQYVGPSMYPLMIALLMKRQAMSSWGICESAKHGLRQLGVPDMWKNSTNSTTALLLLPESLKHNVMDFALKVQDVRSLSIASPAFNRPLLNFLGFWYCAMWFCISALGVVYFRAEKSKFTKRQ